MGSYSSNSLTLRLVSYTKIMASHVNQGRHLDALSLFHHLHASSAPAVDAFVFPHALKSCTAAHRPLLGAAIHALVTKLSLVSDPFVASALVNMYGKCVSVSSARQLFDEILHRNVVVWNAMISTYTHSGRVSDALGLFDVMDVEPNASTFTAIISGLSGLEDGSFKALSFYRRMGEAGLKQDLVTLLALLRACADLAALSLIKEIHGYAIRNGIDPHSHLRSCLVDAYGRCGCIVNAQCVFETMSTRERNVVVWNAMISTYLHSGRVADALGLFEVMDVEPDAATFNTIISGLSGLEDGSFKALSFYRRMGEAGLKQDLVTLLALLRASVDLAALSLIKEVHGYAIRNGIDQHTNMRSCLVDAYGRCGRIVNAQCVFETMSTTENNVVVWNAMISTYMHSGLVADALGLFEVIDVEPDASTFNAIISGLSGLGDGSLKALSFYRRMVEAGLKQNLITLFALIRGCEDLAALSLIKEIHGYAIRNGIEPQPHLRSCLVEAYGRCGCIVNAQCVFETMSTRERDVVAWSSLISAYVLNGDFATALETFEQMEMAKVQPDGLTFLVVLKACRHAGLADEALGYLGRMRKDYGVEASSHHYSCVVDVLSRAGRLNEAYEVMMGMPMITSCLIPIEKANIQ